MAKKKIKLAEALLRRKELAQKVKVLQQIDQNYIFKTVFSRKRVNEELDDVVAQVPRVSAGQITGAYDHHARALRKVDAAIQQANWTAEVEVDADVLADYKEPDNLKGTEIPMAQGR